MSDKDLLTDDREIEGADKFVPMIETADYDVKKKLIDTTLALYDPDTLTEFNFSCKKGNPFQEWLKANFEIKAGVFSVKKDDKGIPVCEVQAKMYTRGKDKLIEANEKKGIKKHTERLEGRVIAKDVNAFSEALTKANKLHEDFGGAWNGFDTEPMYGGQIEIAVGDLEYTPMMSGAFTKQLYFNDYLLMHSRCFEMYNHNPVAHQIIEITTGFVLGRGVKVAFKTPECQKIWDRFAERNNFYERIKTWSRMLARDGELMVRTYVDKTGLNGDVIVRAIDPSTVWEIVTDPEDIENVYYYHQQFATQYQVFFDVNPLNIPSTKYVINQIPASEVLHYKVNVNANEKRGRSDLYSVMTWLKRLKDFYTARTIRGILQASFVWKMIIKGNNADVVSAKQSWGTNPPKAGTVWFENESATLSTMGIDLKANDAKDDGEALLNLVCVGVGIPKEYLGLGDKSTRATAIVSSEPGAKKFQDRQDLFKKIVSDVARIVMHQASVAGDIPATTTVMPEGVVPKIITAIKAMDWHVAFKLLRIAMQGGLEMPIDDTFEVIMPEIIIDDRSQKLKDLTLAQVNGWISKETAGNIAGKELHIDSYDYDEELVNMKKDATTPGTNVQTPSINPATGAISFGATPPGQQGDTATAKNAVNGTPSAQIRKDAVAQKGKA